MHICISCHHKHFLIVVNHSHSTNTGTGLALEPYRGEFSSYLFIRAFDGLTVVYILYNYLALPNCLPTLWLNDENTEVFLINNVNSLNSR